MREKPNSPPKLVGDSPKQSIEQEDEFGLSKFTKGLTAALKDRIAAEGYVIGIEGEWGSGKSSFINFVIEEIHRRELQHQVIRFEPWLIGNRDRLLVHFFELLASHIKTLGLSERRVWPPSKWFFGRSLIRLSDKIKQYGQYAAKLSSPLAAAANTDPSGSIAALSIFAKTFGVLSLLLPRLTFEKIKSEIEDHFISLRQQYPGLKFVVVIDDIDRLEPNEAIEILRLIAKVANFPSVVYLLCYDRAVIAKQINTCLETDGDEYLEKIIHHSLPIPPLEAFSLRRLLQKKLSDSFPEAMSERRPDDPTYDERRRAIFDTWAGKLLKTPRDVVRVHEAIVFGWPYVADKSKTDFLDFVWLEIVKAKAKPLYEWVRHYLSEVGAYRDHGRASDGQPRKDADRLIAIMTDIGWDEDAQRFVGLSYFLPGVEHYLMEGEKRKVFQFNKFELAKFENGCRLGSPSHWRRYFAFDLPSYAVPDEEAHSFRRAAVSNIEEATNILRRLFSKPHTHTGHFLDVLLDRLIDLSPEKFSGDEATGIALSLSNIMDEIASEDARLNGFGRYDIWIKASALLKNRTLDFRKLFTEGPSLNWLAESLRSLASSHGLPDEREPQPEAQYISRDDLDYAIDSMIDRFRKTGMARIFKMPDPLQILYCWSQLGDKEEVNLLISDAVKDDEVFLDFIYAARSQINSSNKGIYNVVKEQYIGSFMDSSSAKTRLYSLTKQSDESGERARQLLEMWASQD